APNVLIEGTSLLQTIPVHYAILVVPGDLTKPKPSVRRALVDRKINAFYLSGENFDAAAYQERVLDALSSVSSTIDKAWLATIPIFTAYDLPKLSLTCVNELPKSFPGAFQE